ncbi:MAG: hypothetical protein RLZZ141_544, partial [Pseudomonadota bacterium]
MAAASAVKGAVAAERGADALNGLGQEVLAKSAPIQSAATDPTGRIQLGPVPLSSPLE